MKRKMMEKIFMVVEDDGDLRLLYVDSLKMKGFKPIQVSKMRGFSGTTDYFRSFHGFRYRNIGVRVLKY